MKTDNAPLTSRELLSLAIIALDAADRAAAAGATGTERCYRALAQRCDNLAGALPPRYATGTTAPALGDDS